LLRFAHNDGETPYELRIKSRSGMIRLMAADRDVPISPAETAALFHDLQKLPAVVVAVSGGPDSTALMLLAARWRKSLARGPKLIAVTVDHGLRPEARDEARAVADLARKLGVAHRSLRWMGRKPSTGLQEAARAARYRLLAEAARKAGASTILTAHTLDDQAETVLIRLTRGSGLTGLAGMRRARPLPTVRRAPSPQGGEGWGEGDRDSHSLMLPLTRRASRADLSPQGRGGAAASCLLLRPLLTIPKSRLIATLRAENVPFAQDPSNADPRFTRVRLRGLMPKLVEEGLDARTLALLAGRMGRAEEALSLLADELYETMGKRTVGRIDFPGPEMLGLLPDELALRLLGRAIDALGDEGPVGLGKLEALHSALKAAFAGKSRVRRSLAGAVVTLNLPSLTVERAPPRRSRRLTTAAAGKRRSSR
jgi:tRNA(Ile)-lysidine synthase